MSRTVELARPPSENRRPHPPDLNFEIRLSGAAKTIPCGSVFRFEGHAALHLIDPIAMNAIIGDPDSNRLKYENRSGDETYQQHRLPWRQIFRLTLHVPRYSLWKSTPGQAVSEDERGIWPREKPPLFARNDSLLIFSESAETSGSEQNLGFAAPSNLRLDRQSERSTGTPNPWLQAARPRRACVGRMVCI
jgi:hypothetical protein